jgi:1,4-dihydroxy-2-naphthoate polyprenyltransferase
VVSRAAGLRPTAGQWWAGARPRTLPAAIAPVLAGSGLAYYYEGFVAAHALLALVVSLALQIGVNYANDYSDGIRGTDAVRVGPRRLVGSGLASPGSVRAAAFGCFAVAGAAGLLLVVLTGFWWLLALGAACILAAWFYTGGRHPYGYLGLGELFVFVFFGLVAVGGTVYVQLGWIPLAGVVAGVVIGALACALLVVNNLRDLESDARAGKRTLATRIGDRATRTTFLLLVAASGVSVFVLAGLTSGWALLGLAGLAFAVAGVRTVLQGATGPALIAVLQATGLAELGTAVGLAAGLVISAIMA